MQIAETVAPDITREEFARWIASQHLAIDPGIVAAYYLPMNAQSREIRLIEVNQSRGLSNRLGPVDALDFSVDVEGLERFTVLVADVAPFEWEAILKRELALPRGWCLESSVEIRGAEIE